jgi:hypothetical protein
MGEKNVIYLKNVKIGEGLENEGKPLEPFTSVY